MKKILFVLVALGMYSVANAATSTGAIALSGTLSASCLTTIGTGNITFVLVPGVVATPATSTYSLACTAGTEISSITALSTNTWTMVEPVSSDAVPYSLTATGFSASYTNALIPTWSSGTSITTVSAAPFSINGTADPVIAMLTITPDITPIAANIGTYADNITITANY